jgi:hypothetical protein
MAGLRMTEDVISPWLSYGAAWWIALPVALIPAAIAGFKRRPVLHWYVYGLVAALVFWPLIALTTLHALVAAARRDPLHPAPPEVRERERRQASLALLAEASVPSWPSWIEGLRRKSPDGTDRRRYAYEKIAPGESIELVREGAAQHDSHAVAFRHHGVLLGYVPRRHAWVARAIDDGRRLFAIVDRVKIGGVMRRRAKHVHVRIVALDAG